MVSCFHRPEGVLFLVPVKDRGCLSVSSLKGDLSREILFGWSKWVVLYKNWYCQKAAALFNSCSAPLEVLGSRGIRLSGLIPWRTFQVAFRLVIDYKGSLWQSGLWQKLNAEFCQTGPWQKLNAEFCHPGPWQELNTEFCHTGPWHEPKAKLCHSVS